MALIPAPHCIIVTPSLVKNNEHETASGLQVVTHETRPQRDVHRGVVERVGSHIDGELVKPGFVAHYTDFVAVEDLHVVPESFLIAWEDNEG